MLLISTSSTIVPIWASTPALIALSNKYLSYNTLSSTYATVLSFSTCIVVLFGDIKLAPLTSLDINSLGKFLVSSIFVETSPAHCSGWPILFFISKRATSYPNFAILYAYVDPIGPPPTTIIS